MVVVVVGGSNVKPTKVKLGWGCVGVVTIDIPPELSNLCQV